MERERERGRERERESDGTIDCVNGRFPLQVHIINIHMNQVFTAKHHILH